MALAGMEAGLKHHRYRRIMVELHPPQLAERGRRIGDVANGLKAKGYQGFALDYSLAGIRKAYYHAWLDFSEFIVPLERGLSDPGDPRVIWLAPGEADLM